jgi:proline iminopeptidase
MHTIKIRYELSISKTFPDETKLMHVLETPTILVPFALFEAHYMLHNGFLRRGQLLDSASAMAGIPTVLKPQPPRPSPQP